MANKLIIVGKAIKEKEALGVIILWFILKHNNNHMNMYC